MKKLLIFLFILLLLIPLIDAAKPTQVFTGTTNGLELRIPQGQFLLFGEEVELNMHVFNLSNGLPLINDTTSCHLHIYNTSGNHIHNCDVPFGDKDYDFAVKINSTVLSYIGFYSYIVQCNTSRFGGFVSGSVEVTADGTEETNAESIKLMAALLGVLILVALFIILTFNLGEEHYLLKLFFMLMAIITIMVIPQLIIKGVSFAETNILKIPLWAFRIFVLYLFIYVFYNWARKSERFMRWFGSQK